VVGRIGKTIAAAAVAAVIGLGTTAPASATLLTNGGFETGDFTGWSVSEVFSFVGSGPQAPPSFPYAGPKSGTNYALLGQIGNAGTISQGISDTLGKTYSVTYWLAGVGDSPSYFDAYWNGTLIAGSDRTDFNSAAVYQKFQFSVVGSGSDVLLFHERDDPGYMALDSVSIKEVPEPGTLAMLGAGLIGSIAARRKRKARA